MLPNKQLVKNITDLFKYASHFKKIFLIADKDDGMYDREMAFEIGRASCKERVCLYV